jgi:hypothetical protein
MTRFLGVGKLLVPPRLDGRSVLFGQRINSLDHGEQAVSTLRTEMLIQSKLP